MSKATKTKQYIIETTAQLFNTKGVSGTSLNDLTEATGLSKGALYGNFENKDEIALSAFDYNLSLIINGIKELQEQKSDPVGKLRAFITYYRGAFENPALQTGCPLMNTATEADDTHPKLREKVKGALTMWRKSIEFLVQQGIDQWKIKRNVNPASFACVMISMIEGGLIISKATDDPTFLYQVLDKLDLLIETEIIL